MIKKLQSLKTKSLSNNKITLHGLTNYEYYFLILNILKSKFNSHCDIPLYVVTAITKGEIVAISFVLKLVIETHPVQYKVSVWIFLSVYIPGTKKKRAYVISLMQLSSKIELCSLSTTYRTFDAICIILSVLK